MDRRSTQKGFRRESKEQRKRRKRERKKKCVSGRGEEEKTSVIYPTPVERTTVGGTDWVGHGSRR